MVGVEDLFAAKDEILSYFNDNINCILTTLNRLEKLDDFIEMMGMDNPFHIERIFQGNRKGRIVVIGESKLSKSDMLLSAGKMGLSKDRFELFLRYEDAKTLDVRKYQYKDSYAAILVGPMPHSGSGKGDFSSIITRMEDDEGYPRVVRMGENDLKITKSGFQKTLQMLLNDGILEKDC